jgi:hypothetical protein
MTRESRGLWSAVALTLLVAACGGGAAGSASTVPADAPEVSAALLSALGTDATAGPFDAVTAQCAAAGMIDAVGLERMATAVNAAGESLAGDPTALFAQLTADESAQALAAAEACLDLASAVPATMKAFGFPEDVSTCVGTALVAGGFGEPLIAAYLTAEDPTDDAAFTGAYVGALSGTCAEATHQMIVDEMTYYGVSDTGAACVADSFAAAANFSEIVAVWMGAGSDAMDTTAVDAQLTQIFSTCLTAEELASLGIDTTATTGGGTTTTPTTQP